MSVRRQLGWAAVGVMLLGCGQRVPFERRLAGSSRIEVRHNDRVLRAVDNEATITKAVEFITSRSGGWSQDWAGTPVPVFVVYFFRGKQIVGGYGVGPDFLTTDPGPVFWSRSVSPSEAREIANILGVDLERR
ncbi:MAG TPA: hypothetical protein PKJ41_07575 [Bryobacteraceae bacterium]|nr:hypothetical protein [Bryobacteraceae bacterium]